MRYKSDLVGGFQVFAVTGVNTVSFAVEATAAAKKGLLGFAVERKDAAHPNGFYMYGFKVFESVVSHPIPDMLVTTYDHPIQSFVWDDFTAKPDETITYVFHPLKGAPNNLDRSAAPIPIRIRTEPLFSSLSHDVFFNRGVASSQAYARKFDNKKPDQLPPAKRAEALQWLSRELDEALIKFIRQAKPADALRCCFYEFRYGPVLEELKQAIDRNVDVQIIVDMKENQHKVKGKLVPSFPRKENLAAIKAAKIPAANIIKREARKSSIQHNKFMVLLKGAANKPAEVWTGSTNLSAGGIHGQTNVGHWIRDAATASAYLAYWTLLSADPGGQPHDTTADVKKKNAAFRSAVDALSSPPTSIATIARGITPIFSPRTNVDVLDLYVKMVDSAKASSFITLAFGVNADFKDALSDNTPQNHITFLLLEKKDKPTATNAATFVALNASNNVYSAWGAYLGDALYQWTRETNARILQHNSHVAYIHSKFMLVDPLSADPIVVSGSANFSKPSTDSNDENMVIIRGDQRVADIYFTEFNRLFIHYYFRAVQEATAGKNKKGGQFSLFLDETDAWLGKYKEGGFRQKRVELLTKMSGVAQPPP